MRISSRAIIFDETRQNVLLMFRRKIDDSGNVKEYFVVPGGGVEEGENLESAAIRELKEEMNIDIAIVAYVGLETVPQGYSNYYEAKLLHGTPLLSGEENDRMSTNNYYEPKYLPITELDKHTVWGKEFIIKALENKYEKLDNAKLTDQNICPTCYNKLHNNVIFGDNSHQILFEDDIVEVFFAGTPRKVGHTVISTKKHYKDMIDLDINLIDYIFKIAQITMQVLKEKLSAESVYLCTMCDGPNNHFHLQLLPRYISEERGSKNFVATRQVYVHDENLVNNLKVELKKTLLNSGVIK